MKKTKQLVTRKINLSSIYVGAKDIKETKSGMVVLKCDNNRDVEAIKLELTDMHMKLNKK